MPPDLSIDLRVSAGSFRLELALEVERGPLVLVGPNGSGKTMLLRALAGGLAGVEGRIVVRGTTLLDTAVGICLPPEERRVGYLPQGYGLFPHLSAADNVAYGLREGDRADRRGRAVAILDQLGVGQLAERRPRRLSGGEQQRVALARALATDPALLLLDEPTAALDAANRRETRAMLRTHLHDPARCSVAVTHDARDLAAWRPTVALVVGGRLLDLGTPEQLLSRAEHPFLLELLAPSGEG